MFGSGSLGSSQLLRPDADQGLYAQAQSPNELFNNDLKNVKDEIKGEIFQLAFMRPLQVKDQYNPQSIEVADDDLREWIIRQIAFVHDEIMIEYDGLSAYEKKLNTELNDDKAFSKCMVAIGLFKLTDLRNKYTEKYKNLPYVLQDLGLVKRPAPAYQYPQPQYQPQPQPQVWRPAAAAPEPANKYQGSLAVLRNQLPLGNLYTDFDDTIRGLKETWENSQKLTVEQFLESYLPKTSENYGDDGKIQKFASKFFEYSKSIFVNSAMYERRKMEVEILNPEKDVFEKCLNNLAYPYIAGLKAKLEEDHFIDCIEKVIALPNR